MARKVVTWGGRFAGRAADSSDSSHDYYATMTNAPASAAAWSAAGRYFFWKSTLRENAAFGPVKIFNIRLGDRRNPAILVIHGYPTSSWDFMALAVELSRDFYVCALDTPGYGFSDKPRNGWRYSIFDDARLVDYFVRASPSLSRFTLVTHDKGDSVGLALLQKYQEYDSKPYAIDHHVITNGSIWLPLARLSVGQKALLAPRAGPALARLLTPNLLARVLSKHLYRPPLGAAEAAALASIFAYQDGTKIEHELIRYLDERKLNEARWLEALRVSDIPTTLVWGEKDPIAPVAVADYVWIHYLETRPAAATYWRIPSASHYLQHDQPEILAAIIRTASGIGPNQEAIQGARLEGSVSG
jgi:pimeloyl-ACP methyl ester carboxylesterase